MTIICYLTTLSSSYHHHHTQHRHLNHYVVVMVMNETFQVLFLSSFSVLLCFVLLYYSFFSLSGSLCLMLSPTSTPTRASFNECPINNRTLLLLHQPLFYYGMYVFGFQLVSNDSSHSSVVFSPLLPLFVLRIICHNSHHQP